METHKCSFFVWSNLRLLWIRFWIIKGVFTAQLAFFLLDILTCHSGTSRGVNNDRTGGCSSFRVLQVLVLHGGSPSPCHGLAGTLELNGYVISNTHKMLFLLWQKTKCETVCSPELQRCLHLHPTNKDGCQINMATWKSHQNSTQSLICILNQTYNMFISVTQCGFNYHCKTLTDKVITLC